MLSLSQTHNDRRLIRVLVAPIGNNSLFADQFQIVSSLKLIPFYELNRPVTSKSSSFKYLNWKDGELLFEYLRYDRSSAGPGDLDDFQSSKRIWMVMGLINFPELVINSKVVAEEIDHFTRRYNHIGLKRVFVFNYNFDSQPSLQLRPLKNDPDSLIIFPPEGACEGGSMIVVHFKEVMCHATVKLISSFERLMEICEDARIRNILPNELSLHTVYDDREDITATRESTASSALMASSSSVRMKKAFKRKPSGRLHKWMGDLSMQVCSPLDAIDHYIAAIVELRSTADSLWLAGALDGYASVVLMLKERQFNLDEIIGKDLKSVTLPVLPETDEPLTEIDRVYALAEERMCEAISIYSSSVVLRILEVEATLRLARIFEKAEFFFEKEQKIVDYVMKAAAVPGLNSQQQIEVTLEGALICHRLGLRRKYALFLYIAALMTAESGNYEMADALLMETFLWLDKTEGAFAMKEANQDDLCSAWNAVKAAVFTNGVILAQETNNLPSSATFLSALLQITCQSEFRQTVQNARLSKYTNKLLGLERFARRNKISTNSLSFPVTNPSYSVLTEESLKRLQSKDSSVPPGELLVRRSSLTRDSVISLQSNVPPPPKTRSINSDLTTSVGGLKGSIRAGPGDASSANSSQPGSNKLTNPMASPKNAHPHSVSSASERPLPVPPATPGVNTYRAQSEKLTPTNHPPQPPHPPPPPPPGSVPRKSNLQETASAIVSPADNNDFLANHFNELTTAAENALKQGLRSISVPSLPHKLSNLVSSSKESNQANKEGTGHYPITGSAKKRQSSVHRGSATSLYSSNTATPTKAKLFNDKFLKVLLESNMFDNNGTTAGNNEEDSANGSGVAGSNLADPRVMYHMIDLEQAKDIFQSLSQSLTTSSLLPVDQQEVALSLFYQISEKIEKVEHVSLPFSFLNVSPLVLPNPIQPIPFRSNEYPVFKAFIAFVQSQISLRAKAELSVATGERHDEPVNELSAAPAVSTFRFIVDPFSKKKDKKSTGPEEIAWNSGMMCHFRVILRNPLAIPIHISSIKLIATGCRHVVYPISIDIPPESESFEVFLPLFCLEKGALTVRSLHFMIGNFLQEISVDNKGLPTITSSLSWLESVTGRKTPFIEQSKRPAPSSSITIPSNTVKVIDAYYPIQCYTSWGLTSLVNVRGPTPNHLQIEPSRISLYAGEIRRERIWVVLPSHQTNPNEPRGDWVRLFQVVVYEYEREAMTKRSYLLQDYFCLPFTTSTKEIITTNAERMAQKCLLEGNHSHQAKCLIQRLSASKRLSKSPSFPFPTVEVFEFSFEICSKSGVSSFDFEISTFLVQRDLHDTIQSYLSLPPASAEQGLMKAEWLNLFYEERIPLTDLTSLNCRNLLLHVSLDYSPNISCTDMNIIQLPDSPTSKDDVLLRRLLLQQWKYGQQDKQRLVSIASISDQVLADASSKGLSSSVSKKYDKSSNDNESLSVPRMIVFTEIIRVQFVIMNHSNKEMMVGTSLAKLQDQWLRRDAFSSLQSADLHSASSSGAVCNSEFITSATVIHKLEEIATKDYLLLIPAKTGHQLIIEYTQEAFLRWQRATVPTPASSTSSASSSSVFVAAAFGALPLFWMCIDEEKVTNSMCDERLFALSDSKLEMSTSVKDYFRCGRLEFISSESAPATFTMVMGSVVRHDRSQVVYLNVGFQSDSSREDLQAAARTSIANMKKGSNSTCQVLALSEVGRLLSYFPLVKIDANLTVHPSLLAPSSPMPRSISHQVSLQGAFPQQQSIVQLRTFQRIDIDFQLTHCTSCSHYPNKSPKQVEILLILSDLFDDQALNKLSAELEKRINPLEDDLLGNPAEEEANPKANSTLQQANHLSNASSNAPLSFLINGKLHCKYFLPVSSNASQVAHSVNLTFLNSSRYSLYTYFRLIFDDEVGSSVWWSCETALQFIVMNQ